MNPICWTYATALIAVLVGSQSAAAAEAPAVELKRGDASIEITIGGEPFATYVFQDPAISRPYFMNVRAPGGVQVTRNQPPVAGTDLMDHPTFHPGIWLAFGDISGADTWRLTAPVKLQTLSLGRDAFVAKYAYHPAADSYEILCEEFVACRVRPTDAGRLITWDSTFMSDREFYFGDQEEMGLGIRVATAIRAQKQADGGIAAGNGAILDSEGRKDEKEVWGKTADWCDYSGLIDGQRVGMTIFSHPDNFRPSWFHARDRGLLEANPFGEQAFTDGGPSKVVVKPGERLRLQYGILVHSNAADAAPPDLAAAYKNYIELTSEK